MEEVPLISLKRNFTPHTFGCYGLNSYQIRLNSYRILSILGVSFVAAEMGLVDFWTWVILNMYQCSVKIHHSHILLPVLLGIRLRKPSFLLAE